MVNALPVPPAPLDPGQTVPPPTVEVHSIDYVPPHERHGSVLTQSPFWFIGNFQFSTVALGLIGPAIGLSLGWSIVAGTAGLLFGTFFMAMHASQGPVLGLPQMIQSRAQFGYRGAVLVLLATLCVFGMGSIVSTMLISIGLNSLFGWSSTIVGALVVIGSGVLAVFGHEWLHRSFQIILLLSAPFYLVLSIAILAGGAGGQAPPDAGFTLTAFMTVFAIGAGYNIGFAPYVSDYSRYLPEATRAKSLVISVFCGAAGSGIWLMALGSWLASRLGAFDVFVGLQTAGNNVFGGLGTLIVVLSAVSLIGTLAINNYSAALSVLTVVDSFRPVAPTRALRVATNATYALIVLMTALALPLSYLDTLSNAVLFILYLLVPWTAVNLVDFFFVRRGNYAIAHLFHGDGLYPMYEWRGICAYVAGFVAMIPFMNLTFYTGPAAAALGGVDYAFAVGLAVAGGCYLAAARNLDLTSEFRVVADSNAALRSSLDPDALPQRR